jgi:hypothetical protein
MSCGEREIKFFHEWPKVFTESFVDWAKDVVGLEMLAMDAAAGAAIGGQRSEVSSQNNHESFTPTFCSVFGGGFRDSVG